jgi:hypothetical protein
MKRTVWTAISTAPWLPLHGRIEAQCKSSKAELIRRVRADDPAWVGPWVRFERRPRWHNRKFRRGLAFQFVSLS